MSEKTPDMLPTPNHTPLPSSALRWRVDPSIFSFETTDDLEELQGIIGQRRALEAMEIGAEIHSPGYNIFVNGLAGTGRLTTIKNILEGMQTAEMDLYDIGFVNNFSDPDRPCVLRLPKGKMRSLRADVKDAISFLRSRIPAMFEDEKFRKGRARIVDRFQEKERNMVGEFEEKIKPRGFILGQRQTGPNVIQPELLPMINGTPYGVDDLDALIRDEKITVEDARKINQEVEDLQDDLYELMKKGRKLAGDYRQQIVDYERSAATMLVTATLEEIISNYTHDSVKKFLRDVRNDILENLDLFRPQREAGEEREEEVEGEIQIEDPFHVYDINILLDNTDTDRRPVIIERSPSFTNLFGTIERTRDPQDRWVSDFSSIKGGSVLQADGGYLIINAVEALTEPGVWNMMKRVLLHRKIQIQPLENFFQYGGIQSTSGMKPEEIRLNVKVIMIGPSELYQALFHAEEDFRKIFKINAQFDYEIERTDGILTQYAHFIKKLTKEEQLPPFDVDGVAAVTEYAVERAGGAGKISLRFSDIADILREASYWTVKKGNHVVSRRHVDKAIRAMIERNSMWKEKITEQIDDGTLMIATDGSRVGQINGLAVYDLGQVSFGKPTRITATVSVGRSGIVNIDREANLSGSIYNKGALILTGFFRHRFAQSRPLSFSASIVFEQSYGGVDGDSASSTEVYALLSALSRVPIRQDFAVTGSVNQWGEIQPIGGVKEKIEGFFDVCCRRGLTGTQGVLIPIQNVPELMLREDVVTAVEKGEFHIYSVSTIDQGIEILTGIAAGVEDSDGNWTEGSINALVKERLEELSEKLRYGVPILTTEDAALISMEVKNGK
ncbi:MAG: AAA family ATPase [Ignavibacteriae bacterium]|nr:AAA family ATPase [Ignavibacteriota bacterium]MCB9217668.1 AAA family ATPase [Ignavibacteria bacterium]